jgi:hypothetical protein
MNSAPTDDRLPAPASSLPVVREPVAPWLAGAVVLGLLSLVLALRGTDLRAAEAIVVLVGLVGTIAAGALVVRRSRRELDAALREERARPSADELYAPTVTEALTYPEGMERWTESMLELIEHAVDVLGTDAPERAVLASAAEDTRDLRDLLGASIRGARSANDQARLHAIASLWDSGQPRIEQMAGAADPDWYRRWRSRRVADRRLRHGVNAVEQRALDLPYRS